MTKPFDENVADSGADYVIIKHINPHYVHYVGESRTDMMFYEHKEVLDRIFHMMRNIRVSVSDKFLGAPPTYGTEEFEAWKSWFTNEFQRELNIFKLEGKMFNHGKDGKQIVYFRPDDKIFNERAEHCFKVNPLMKFTLAIDEVLPGFSKLLDVEGKLSIWNWRKSFQRGDEVKTRTFVFTIYVETQKLIDLDDDSNKSDEVEI